MMIRNTLMAAMIGIGICGGGAAQAVTWDLGTLSATPPASGTVHHMGAFSDIIQFDVGGASTLGGTVADVSFSSFLNIDNLSVALQAGDGSSLGNWAGDSMTFLANLAAGEYYFAVSGIGVGSLGGIYQYAVSAAPVPEPGEWALMLSGLGLMGFMMRRRQSRLAA